MKQYPAITSAFYNTPLLLAQSKAIEIQSFLQMRAAGAATTPIDVQQPQPFAVSSEGLQAPIDVTGSVRGGERQYVAVLPLFGLLFQHGGMEMQYSGGTSTEQFAAELRKLLSLPAIKTIVLHVHSPGGQAWGTEEAADVIYNARQSGKRIVAVVNSMMASGALWIATAAHEVQVTSGGEMGSIGVLMVHQDFSKHDEKLGIATTLLAIPPKKVEGNQFEPLPEETKAEWLEEIEQTYRRFVNAVARNRNASPAKVERDFGQGGMLRAREAVSVGLADGVATLHEVVQREVRRLQQPARASVRNRLAILAAEN